MTTTVMTITGTLDVSRLNDQQLLANIKELARQERWINTQIIDHLREIAARGLHLRAGFSGLFDYAVKELGFGEGSAYQRIQALKLCTEYPELKQDLQDGELSITSMGSLQSAFDRHDRRHRQLVREQRKSGAGGRQPDGVAEASAALPPGDAAKAARALGTDLEASMPAESAGTPLSDRVKRDLIERARGKTTRQVNELIAEFDPDLIRPRERLRALGHDRWELKAVVDGECRRGLEQLRQWLSHVNPAMEHGELLQRLVADAVAKYDPARQPVRRRRKSAASSASPTETGPPDTPERQRKDADARRAFAQKRSDASSQCSRGSDGRRPAATVTRTVPAAVRRHIWLRDRGRCTYRDPESGRCCGSRHLVQIDHIQPYSTGGSASADNLRLLCAAHNRARVTPANQAPEKQFRRPP